MDDSNEFPSLDVTDANEALLQYYGDEEEVIAKHTQCSLCGGNLHFSHVTDFSRNVTQETAKCPECGIRIRRILHKLQ